MKIIKRLLYVAICMLLLSSSVLAQGNEGNLEKKFSKLLNLLSYQEKIAGSRLRQHVNLIIPNEQVFLSKETPYIYIVSLDPKYKIENIKITDKSGKTIFNSTFPEGKSVVSLPTKIVSTLPKERSKEYQIVLIISTKYNGKKYQIKRKETFSIVTPDMNKELKKLEQELQLANKFKNKKDYHLYKAVILDEFTQKYPQFDFTYNRNLEIFLAKISSKEKYEK